MPFITQLCRNGSVSADEARQAWQSLACYVTSVFALTGDQIYGSSPDYVDGERTGGRDIVFIVHLHETPERLAMQPDRVAARLAEAVDADMKAAGYARCNIGILLHFGTCGWGESRKPDDRILQGFGRLALGSLGGVNDASANEAGQR